MNPIGTGMGDYGFRPGKWKGMPRRKVSRAKLVLRRTHGLTYMTTLMELVALGKLRKHEPELERDEFPDRHVYLSPEAQAWMDATLILAPRDRGRDLLPREQVNQLLFDFVIGRPLAYDSQRKKLDPLTQHVWELKTEDVRLIGWFPRKKSFVAVFGRMKREIPRAKLYMPCITHVVWFRANLDLDAPKSVTGVRYDDIL